MKNTLPLLLAALALAADGIPLHAQGTGLVVTSSNNVGIGNTNPQNRLTVGANPATLIAPAELFQIGDVLNTGPFMTIAGSGNVKTVLGTWSGGGANANGGFIGTYTGASFIFRTNNVDRMIVTSGGNVGIGTTAPVAHLEIDHNATNFIRFDGGGGSTNGNFLFEQSTDYSDSFPLVAFTTNDSNTARANTLVRIHSNETDGGAIPFEVTSQGTLASPTYTALAVNYVGNVGIGTVSPRTKLNVEGGDASVGGGRVFRAFYDSSDNNYSSTLNWYGLQLGNNGSNYIVAGRTNPNGNLNFVVNNTSDFPTINGITAMFIASSGNVGIGTTSPNYKLDVNGSVHATSFVSSTTTYADFVF